MNKRDFYKELMSEYSFDKEKIFINAKKGRFAGQRSLPIYIGMTAAAAAVVVAVGTLSVTLNGKRGAEYVPNSGSTLAALTEKERMDKALEEIRKNENSSEMHDVMITFSRTLSPSQAQNVITQFSDGSVPVKLLYMSDGSTLSGESAVGAVFSEGSGEITGAIINCPGYIVGKINSSPLVFMAEIIPDGEDISAIAPLPTNTEKPGVTDPVVSDPNNNSGGFGTNPNPGGDIDNTSEEPDGNSDVETSTPQPVTPAQKLPDGVELLDGYEKPSYITDDIGAQKAYFLSENVFYVKTENAVRLYKWNGETETLAAQQTIADAKVCWISENGLRLMITGVENGVRNKMYIVDANNCTISDMRAEDIVLDGSIFEAAYNERSDILSLNVLDGETYYLYTANLSGYQAANAECIASGYDISLLAANNGAVYYREYSDIVKYSNNEFTKLTTLDGAYSIAVNSAFTHAVLSSGNGSFIFDPASEKLIPVQSSAVSFGVSAHSFSLDGNYYTVSGGEIIPASGISVIAKIDFKRSFSSQYMAAVSNGSVRIIPSVYTNKAKNETLTFDTPTENASERARSAVNTGLGVINAIANAKCADCGIDTAQKLSDTIDVCFTKNAASALKARCEIKDSGELSYQKGGLSVINISDTTLIMQDDLQGTLYIKAGTFNGKTAYFTRTVKLSEENGALKLDCIID